MASPALRQNDISQRLIELMLLDCDAVAAYEAAIHALESENLRGQLARFREHHKRHILMLSQRVRDLGELPPARTELQSVIHLGRQSLGSGDDERDILRALARRELEYSDRYSEALIRFRGWPGIQRLLENHLRDERRHRDWFEEQLGIVRLRRTA